MSIDQVKALVERAYMVHNGMFVEFSDRQEQILIEAFELAENEKWNRVKCEPYISMLHSAVQSYDIARSRGRI